MATAMAEEAELKTYWCHECDMSVALTSSPSPLLCPHCHTHFLELMDSPTQNDAVPPLSSSSLSLFDSPFLHRLIHHHLVSNNTDTHSNDDVVFEDPLALFSPTLTTKTASSKSSATAVPIIIVTSSLLSQLDPNGVVSCAVCKDDIQVDAEAKQLPCKHLYHSDCITPWLELHDSCPLCRFRLSAAAEEEEVEEDVDGGALTSSEIRRQLRAAMVRLSELMEEEEDDFYGLRTTLNHIASRHGLIGSNGGYMVSDGERGGSDSGSESVSRFGGGGE